MRRLRGFSLLEIALVLAIIGVIGSISLPMMTSFYKLQREQRTEQNLNQTIQALGAYVLVHNHLPCPAVPGANDKTAGQSEEGTAIGIIPYRTLGLTEFQARDGYHHWITYAVVPDLTQSTINCLMTKQEGTAKELVFCEVPCPLYPITVLNDNRQSVLSGNSTGDFIAFVLVSHGTKGDGAFNNKGSRNPTIDPDKQINGADDFNFIDRRASANTEGGFNDKVKWVTRNNLMAIYAKQPCQPRNDKLSPLFPHGDGSKPVW